ncbi:hypothetical protein HMPREF0299_5860 [Corynebacterium matruchotii ATCC 14266]|uniref:Uncharacterized protein n=1 Tax=Corynebacterium matruchotii ATCC 14266 TaxID=553207 RepID=E0DC15_9CORY|nr:hypothetical protein HMPREF0299_5860 [Corynebacterium matruchotii ATCC 14266]
MLQKKGWVTSWLLALLSGYCFELVSIIVRSRRNLLQPVL